MLLNLWSDLIYFFIHLWKQIRWAPNCVLISIYGIIFAGTSHWAPKCIFLCICEKNTYVGRQILSDSYLWNNLCVNFMLEFKNDFSYVFRHLWTNDHLKSIRKGQQSDGGDYIIPYTTMLHQIAHVTKIYFENLCKVDQTNYESVHGMTVQCMIWLR